jgi:hypothetical protein
MIYMEARKLEIYFLDCKVEFAATLSTYAQKTGSIKTTQKEAL